MATYDDFIADWLTPHSLAFGTGAAVAVVTMWQVRPAGLLATLDGQPGLLLVAGAMATVFASERYRETVRREPPYFVAGVAMGAVLAARLFA